MDEGQQAGARYFGEYKAEKKIGCGSFGCVFRCKHPRLENRYVAIKSFIGNVESEKECTMFREEAKVLEKLDHEHIIHLIDINIQEHPFDKNVPYLVMDYAPYGSLRDLLDNRQGRPISLEKALPVLKQIGQALHYAHQRNIIHRDVKPENILFKGPSHALLADFGIATVLSSATTKQGEVVGTYAYMAPEQFRGEKHRQSDQYALACVAYEMLCGQPPFAMHDKDALKHHHLEVAPARLGEHVASIPYYVDDAILKALSKEHTERYKDVEAFLQALQTPPQQPPFSPYDDFMGGRLPYRPFAASRPSRPTSAIRIRHEQFMFPDDDFADDFLLEERGAEYIPRRARHADIHPRITPTPPDRRIVPRRVARALHDDQIVPTRPQRGHAGISRYPERRLASPQPPAYQPDKHQPRFQRNWKIILTFFFCFLFLLISLLQSNNINGFAILAIALTYLLTFCIGIWCLLKNEGTWGTIFILLCVVSFILGKATFSALFLCAFICILIGLIYGWYHPIKLVQQVPNSYRNIRKRR